MAKDPFSLEPANVTLSGKGVFEEMIKILGIRRPSWMIQDPKGNHLYPYKGQRHFIHGKDHVATEAEIEMMQPQAKKHQQPPEPGRGKEWILP